MHRHTGPACTSPVSAFRPTLITLLAACTLAVGSVACTDQQEREDRPPWNPISGATGNRSTDSKTVRPNRTTRGKIGPQPIYETSR